MKTIDISIVVTFHKEGLLAKYMLDSLLQNRLAAETKGITTQAIFVLDAADADTKSIVSRHRANSEEDIVLEVRNQEAALSRNDGIAAAKGTHVAVVDGDDYYSRDWLVRALIEAQNNPTSIVHPQWVLSFGAINCLMRVIDQRQVNYPMASLLKYNPWVVTSFARRKIFVEQPYIAINSKSSGFAFEDWHWNLETLAHGHMHITAGDTALIYRRKKFGSLLSEQHGARGIMRTSEFFAKWKSWDRVFGIYN